MNGIFISYRRKDAAGEAGRLHHDLQAAFGKNSVFLDVEVIRPGEDFREAIDHSLSSCTAFLCVIGKGWLLERDASRQRRLDDPNDYVRLEVAAAIDRGIQVIPVIVQGTRIPTPQQLPEAIQKLSYLNSFELRNERWDSDVQLLIRKLKPPSFLHELLDRCITVFGGGQKFAVAAVCLTLLVSVLFLSGSMGNSPFLWGTFVGVCARVFAPGKNRVGLATTILLGVSGSALATYIQRAFGVIDRHHSAALGWSVAGAILLLLIYRMAVKRNLIPQSSA